MELGAMALNRMRAIVARLFHRFGIHCATHQIRVILISCVVITSLFYPALALYASSESRIFSGSKLRILDAFLAPSDVPGFSTYAQYDLRNLWSGYTALRIRDDAVSRARCGLERTIRVERVLIQSPLTDDEGALNHQILLYTLHLERRIANLISSRNVPCLRTTDGQCFVLSPLAFWGHDEGAVRLDSNILDTLSLSRNISIAGVPVSPHMVLAGRRANEPAAADFDFATFLALSYFFPETDCLSAVSHSAFLHILELATEGEELVAQVQQPSFIAIEYDPNLSKSQGLSAISAFLYLAYSGFFAYVTWSMRRMDSVHSRIGVTFTALIEITVSTITSLSICTLVGFKVTMVPWELLPIVIVFVGAENMFNLVDAVTKTSITLPVKQRIAEGLSRAGTSNSLKVISYNIILGTIAFFKVGAIRQFCVLAIVVMVAHWFLAHTFFITVLSIDIQRLELEELLRQNASLAPPVPMPSREPLGAPQGGAWNNFVMTAQSLLQGRARKNISLLLLLTTTATLYYATYPAASRPNDSSTIPQRGALSRSRTGLSGSEHHLPAWHIWKLLNPDEDPLLHLRIELPSILTFRPFRPDSQPSDQSREHLFRTLRSLLWFCKIVVLPITATTSALYGLCLYLLKNAELLEAQRRPSGNDISSPSNDNPTLDDCTSFATLPRMFTSDVELLAASKDGKVVASVSVQNELTVWRTASQLHICIDVTDILLRAASTSCAASKLTALALDHAGHYCAVGTGAGVVGVWIVGEDSVQSLTHLSLDHISSGVSEMQWPVVTPKGPRQSPTTLGPSGSVALSVIHVNGVVVNWNVGLAPSATVFSPPQTAGLKCAKHLPVQVGSPPMVAYALEDGVLQVVALDGSETYLRTDYRVQAGNPADPVSQIHASLVELAGTMRLVIGAATEAGVVSLWDGLTAACITILEGVHGPVDVLRIAPVSAKTCLYCGERPLDSFSISLSSRRRVLIYIAHLSVRGRRCSCPQSQPRLRFARDAVQGRRSRKNSSASLSTTVPQSFARSRPSLSPANGLSTGTEAFPVSPHGVHSRRLSEKESHRRQDITLSIPPTMSEHEPAHLVGPADAANSSPLLTQAPSTLWENVTVVRTGDVTCDRGCWDMCQRQVVGIRRRSRTASGATGHGGHPKANGAPAARLESRKPDVLTGATLERWEVWVFDPPSGHLRVSCLDAINHQETPGSPSPAPRRDSCVPQLPFTRVSPLIASRSFALAGFGNTIGVFTFVAEG